MKEQTDFPLRPDQPDPSITTLLILSWAWQASVRSTTGKERFELLFSDGSALGSSHPYLNFQQLTRLFVSLP